MACKQKDAKRPQGRARDDVKVIITSPLKKIVLMFYWWSRALQWGKSVSPACRKEGSFKEGETGQGRNSWSPECGENNDSCTA